MTNDEKFEYWLDIAQYDLTTADAMYNARRWLYVTFMCQQAVEKLIKGLYVLYVDDDIPRTHNINFLVHKFEDKLPSKIMENHAQLFKKLTIYYIQGRYPEYKKMISKSMNEQTVKQILAETKEAFKWLLTLKPSTKS